MKKYLGSKIGFGISILSILMLCLFVGFGIFLLSMLSMSYETPLVIMIVFVFFGTSVFFSYLIHSRKQLYSWGCFEDNRIVVSTLFSKKEVLEYEKLKSCGIATYIHGVAGSSFGSLECYIYFSYEYFDSKYKDNINYWKPKSPHTKVEFNKELYDYLMSVLPKKQARMLSSDYNHYKNKYGDKFIRLTS